MIQRPYAPHSNQDNDLADWTEACMLILGLEELSRAHIQRLLANELVDEEEFDFDDSEGLEAEDIEEVVVEDQRIDILLTAIERRRLIAPKVYPFVVSEGIVSQRSVAGKPIYHFLLWLCVPIARFRLEGKLEDPEAFFDAIVAAALQSLLGPAKTVMFAERYADDESPDPLVRPREFPEAIKRLRELLVLKVKGLPPTDEEEFDEALPARTYKDGGVDVIAWRPFQDDRPAFPIVLAQCTVQKEWPRKLGDVSAELWNSWLTFPTPPIRVLSIPWAASHRATWIDRNLRGGLILDRMRLCELVDAHPASVKRRLGKASSSWLREEIRESTSREEAA